MAPPLTQAYKKEPEGGGGGAKHEIQRDAQVTKESPQRLEWKDP